MQAGFDKKRSCCQFCTSVRVCAGPGLRPLAATEPRNETHSGQALSHLVRHVAKESSSTIELSTAWRLVAEPGVRVCQCKNGTVAHATACAVPVQSIASRTRVTFVGNVVCSHAFSPRYPSTRSYRRQQRLHVGPRRRGHSLSVRRRLQSQMVRLCHPLDTVRSSEGPTNSQIPTALGPTGPYP